jgi:nucleotide-binding universal stress UspA family protein
MIVAAVSIVAAVAVAGVAYWALRIRERPATATPGARRILFPFVGSELSKSALDAALRLAKAENATLVAAYLAEVPLTMPLDSALPRRCEDALPILEAIEQRGARSGVAVDTRIERGRTDRHALAELLEHERYDRIVAPAATAESDGFRPEDIAWLLDHAHGEIVVFRADGSRTLSPSGAPA